MKNSLSLIIFIIVIFATGCSDPDVHTDPYYEPGDNAQLKSLTVSEGSLLPQFQPDVTQYTLELANHTESVLITGIPEDDKASVSGDNNTPVALNVGENEVNINVLAEDGINSGTYTVNINRSENIRTPKVWTFLFYFNCSDLENFVLQYMKQLAATVSNDQYTNYVVLLDTEPVHNLLEEEKVPGCDFEDTRLFSFSEAKGELYRISGEDVWPELTLSSVQDMNMGDAQTLRRFIEFGKTCYPADHYALIVDCHGIGTGGFSYDNESQGDRLHVGEIGHVLNSDHSVDLLFLDACQMGNLETIYQFRNSSDNSGHFSADYVLASPMTVSPGVWNYSKIFARIDSGLSENETEITAEKDIISVSGAVSTSPNGINGVTVYEKKYHPTALTALELARIITEEASDASVIGSMSWLGMTLVCYDMSRVREVKIKLDSVVRGLTGLDNYKDILETARDRDDEYSVSVYNWGLESDDVYVPLYEITELFEAINKGLESSPDPEVSASITALINSVKDLIPFSYWPFYDYQFKIYNLSGERGLSIFLPEGDKSVKYGEDTFTIFQSQWWYNALNVENVNGQLYNSSISGGAEFFGEFAFCQDDAESNNGQIENWFELLDALYDKGEEPGGWNGYSY